MIGSSGVFELGILGHMKITMKVLFVCQANVNRSQIAEAIFNKLSEKNHAISAGIIARRTTVLLRNQHNNPIVPMKGLGYDLSNARVKRVTRAMVHSSDKIVLIFNKKYLADTPLFLLHRPDLELWDVESIGDEIDFVDYCKLEELRIRKIQGHVMDLVKRIG